MPGVYGRESYLLISECLLEVRVYREAPPGTKELADPIPSIAP